MSSTPQGKKDKWWYCPGRNAPKTREIPNRTKTSIITEIDIAFGQKHHAYSCDLLRLLQGSFGPFGPKVQKKPENGFPGPLGPGGRKSRKRVEKESKTSKNSLFWTLFRLFFDFFDPRGWEAPGTHFRTFFGLWARTAQMTPVAGEEDRKPTERGMTKREKEQHVQVSRGYRYNTPSKAFPLGARRWDYARTRFSEGFPGCFVDCFLKGFLPPPPPPAKILRKQFAQNIFMWFLGCGYGKSAYLPTNEFPKNHFA